MALEVVYRNTAGHHVDVSSIDGTSQTIAVCTCGWSDQNISRDLTHTAARAHLTATRETASIEPTPTPGDDPSRTYETGTAGEHAATRGMSLRPVSGAAGRPLEAVVARPVADGREP